MGNPIRLFWDGRDWQTYRTPKEDMYHSCNDPDLIVAMGCEMDEFIHSLSQINEWEWAYRFFNHRADIVAQGIIKEVDHLAGVISSWIF